MQLDWHDLKTNGSPALLRTLQLIETILTQQEAAIAELQYLWSEVIITQQLAARPAPSTLSGAVKDLMIILDEKTTITGSPLYSSDGFDRYGSASLATENE
jgi:hypothetical protein